MYWAKGMLLTAIAVNLLSIRTSACGGSPRRRLAAHYVLLSILVYYVTKWNVAPWGRLHVAGYEPLQEQVCASGCQDILGSNPSVFLDKHGKYRQQKLPN